MKTAVLPRNVLTRILPKGQELPAPIDGILAANDK